MRFVTLLVFLGLFLGCGKEKVEKIVEVEIPTEPSPIEPPPILPPPVPNFITFPQMEQIVSNDLNSLNQADRLNARYLLGCNFYNQGSGRLDFRFSGVNKGINSISTERLLTQAVSIDPFNCVWRVDISEFGVSRSLWREFERLNLVAFISNSVRGINNRFLTQANQPYAWASSFFTTVQGADQLSFDNGLYYKFLEQPKTNAAFFRENLGIDLNREIAEERIHCAGNGSSRIAIGKTRGVCVGRSDDGFFMFTSDTALGEGGADSILVNPFIFEIANFGGNLVTDKAFDFQALEVIYSLPNGLVSGYRLANSGPGIPSILGGVAEFIAPTNVVLDVDQASLGFAADITLGACQNCHHQEAGINFNDAVYDQVIGTGAFNAEEKDLAERFFRQDSFTADLRSANRVHSQSLSELGVSTLEKDPVVTGLIQPLRRELTLEDVAGYTFLTPEEFSRRLNGTNNAKLIFGSLLTPGGKVQFSDLAENYQLLIDDLLLFIDEY